MQQKLNPVPCSSPFTLFFSTKERIRSKSHVFNCLRNNHKLLNTANIHTPKIFDFIHKPTVEFFYSIVTGRGRIRKLNVRNLVSTY